MSFISPMRTDTNGNVIQTGSLQSLGKDQFLQLLVTKLQYQDPLEPMQDEDFVAQLAQFSTLEQMSNISDGINTSNEWDYLQMQSLNNVMASGLIGKDVKATYSSVYLDADNSPTISYTLEDDAQEVKLVVYDSDGSVVATLYDENQTNGSHSITWDGTDSRGNRAAEGYYTIEAVATDADGSTFEPSLSLVGTVQSVVYRDGSAYLTVDGVEVALGDIEAIGEPGTYTDGDN